MMNWNAVAKSLLIASNNLQDEMRKTPASQVAINSATGAAALVLGMLAAAIIEGVTPPSPLEPPDPE